MYIYIFVLHVRIHCIYLCTHIYYHHLHCIVMALLTCNIPYTLCGRCHCFGNAAMTEHALCSNCACSSQGRQLCNRCFGAPGKSLLEQCTDCDVRMDMQGSDHAPVHADWDLLAPLPTPESAPPLSTRYMFTGTLHCVKFGLFFSSQEASCRLVIVLAQSACLRPFLC